MESTQLCDATHSAGPARVRLATERLVDPHGETRRMHQAFDPSHPWHPHSSACCARCYGPERRTWAARRDRKVAGARSAQECRGTRSARPRTASGPIAMVKWRLDRTFIHVPVLPHLKPTAAQNNPAPLGALGLAHSPIRFSGQTWHASTRHARHQPLTHLATKRRPRRRLRPPLHPAHLTKSPKYQAAVRAGVAAAIWFRCPMATATELCPGSASTIWYEMCGNVGGLVP
jgi:hypothetical protein